MTIDEMLLVFQICLELLVCALIKIRCYIDLGMCWSVDYWGQVDDIEIENFLKSAIWEFELVHLSILPTQTKKYPEIETRCRRLKRTKDVKQTMRNNSRRLWWGSWIQWGQTGKFANLWSNFESNTDLGKSQTFWRKVQLFEFGQTRSRLCKPEPNHGQTDVEGSQVWFHARFLWLRSFVWKNLGQTPAKFEVVRPWGFCDSPKGTQPKLRL